VRLRYGPGGQGDILLEPQDGAGFNLGDCFQGKRAEDEEKGSVRICDFWSWPKAKRFWFAAIGVDKSLRVILFGYKILLISMPNGCRLYIPQLHLTIAPKNPSIDIDIMIYLFCDMCFLDLPFSFAVNFKYYRAQYIYQILENQRGLII